MKYTIKIVTEQHYIEGNKLHVFLINGEGVHANTMPLVINENPNNIVKIADSLDGLKFRLEQLGNDVEIKNVVDPDPNFESAEAAQEYLDNK